MEDKLYRAAAALPEPQKDLIAVEPQPARPKRTPRRMFRVAVALVLVLCLGMTAYAYGSMKFGLWSGIHSNAYGDVVLLNWRYDYNFPETLCGMEFQSMSTYCGAPQGASHWEALLSPTYTMHNVDYAGYCGEDNLLYRMGERIDISFGTTENENWKYHFSVAEDGSCNYEGVQPDSQRTVEYRGYVLHLYTVSALSVRWEDPYRKLVIDITVYGISGEEALVDIAKELIDLNAPE